MRLLGRCFVLVLLGASAAQAQAPNANGFNPVPGPPAPVTLVDANGNPASLGVTPTSAVASAIGPVATSAPSLVAKAGPGNLYGYNATAGGSAAFVAVLNATVAPAAGAAIAPLECSAVPANGTYRTRQDIPDRYTVGIVLVFTTSCSTYTAAAPALLGAVVQ